MFEALKKAVMPGNNELTVFLKEEEGGRLYFADMDAPTEDQYSSWHEVSIVVGDGCGFEQRVGTIIFCMHCLRECVLPLSDLFDMISCDQMYCYKSIFDAGVLDFDTMSTTVYLDSITLDKKYQGLGVEEEILSHMDRIVWMICRRRVDAMFGVVTVDEDEQWALNFADCQISHPSKDIVWIKYYGKDGNDE